MTTQNKELKEKLKKCKEWKDYDDVLEENGFKCTRITGGHKQYTKPNHRTIPTQTHGKAPQGDLKASLVRQMMIAITGSAFVIFFFLIPMITGGTIA